MEKNNKKQPILGRNKQQHSSNIVLIGATASGKSTVGFQLARILDIGLIDIDEAIEAKSEKSIPEIFSELGEAGFRALEKEVLAGISSIRNHVIITGGGIIEDDDNWDLIKTLGPIVWLATPTTEVLNRLLDRPDELKKRPLLADAAMVEDRAARSQLIRDKLDMMMKRRESRFNQADFTLSCSYVTAETCAQFIKLRLTQSPDEYEDA
ncbi:MAG: shikimate kinase [Pseudobacteriovorax sp.]|nr:shikimate kinase [Pseudobacteriovorax sp.]